MTGSGGSDARIVSEGSFVASADGGGPTGVSGGGGDAGAPEPGGLGADSSVGLPHAVTPRTPIAIIVVSAVLMTSVLAIISRIVASGWYPSPMFDPELLKGHVAIVTGGGTGIGLAIAKRLASVGARVVIASRSQEHLDAGVSALRNEGHEASSFRVDVRQPEQVEAMVTHALRTFGRIDVLVNNAAGNFICRAEDLSPNGWRTVVDIVLNGSFFCARAFGRELIASGRPGAIVSVLANYVWTGSPGTIHSAAAKAGVQSMTQTLAVEWASRRIRANAVAPGPVESPGAARQLWSTPEAVERITRSVPLGRWGRPDEIADAVVFLASPLSAFITGETLTVDGGTWMGMGGGPYGFLT
jgi:NAD(P)-dependent dehydrogenase (short-subunit alcohol dehydrogenase family)